MGRPLLAAFFLAALSAPQTDAAAHVLPDLANASGRNGPRFESEVFVVNGAIRMPSSASASSPGQAPRPHPSSAASYDFAASDAVFRRILAGSFEPYLRLGDSCRAGLARAGVAPGFLSFHVHLNDPESWRTIARFFSAELDRSGLAGVPLHANEWHTDTRTATKPDAFTLRTGGRVAAILTAAQVVLQEEGVAESCVYRGPDPSANAPEFYGFFHADGRPKRTGLALGLWKGIDDHSERLELSVSRESGPALYALAGRDGAGREAILVSNPSAETTTLRAVRESGRPVEGARLDVVSDASVETATRVVAGDRFEAPGFSALLVALLP